MKTLNIEQHPSLSRHREPIYYQDTQIYHHVYKGLDDDEIVQAIEQTVDAMVARAETDLLLILDLSGVKIDLKHLSTFKRTSSRSKHLIKKIAVIGIHDIQTAFVNYISSVFGLNIQAFDTVEKAKEWLVE